MRNGLRQELEQAWQLLMVCHADHAARAVAEALHELLRLEAARPHEPRVITRTLEDNVKSEDGAG